MGCPYLEIEDQSFLLDNVDSRLDEEMTKRRIGPHDQKKRQKKRVFPIATLPEIFQQLTPKKSLETFWPNYRLCISIGLIRGTSWVYSIAVLFALFVYSI